MHDRSTKKVPSEETSKRKLMEAAVRLFSQKGYSGTSVREIVEEAGVSKPVLYYYFKSKEGLFRAILDDAARWQEEMIAEVLDTPGTATEKLRKLYKNIYDAFLEYPEFFKFIHALIFGLPQGNPRYDLERFHRRMDEVIKAIYLEGLTRREFREADPEDVSSLIMGVNDFCLHLDYMYPEKSDPERAERLLGLAFRGLRNCRWVNDHV
ncbi:MAG: TetR/AcrR family transcriptional regulator [Deltaproteobacteria bacterium]|nr:TetR/AcrR family transcriptional regulator [Deltaproteobacteria bacterium]MBW2017444.1 TetR/AcrR family transcriptional regulator [Deltaproteobacteria bacterium]MBW2129596.1 TetR/AcrR family transcriptional regulator [Deltaproteobacteria bacterium]MBW2304276.1 TetR/AcrR family transcriptional regulator [Deltaproteobacteria bacterium]